MVIRKKSRENLRNQADYGFLEYSESLGKITNEQSRKIMEVLSDDSVDINNKDEIKSKLDGVISDEEFDGLFNEYSEYNKHSFYYLKKYIDDIKLFPSGYEFLSKDLAIYSVNDGYNINNIERDFPVEEIDSFRRLLERNINLIKLNLGVSNADLGKFIYFLANFDGYGDSVNDVVSNIELLKKAGVSMIDDFAKLQKFFKSSIVDNIVLFMDAGIKSVDEILELEDKELLTLNPEYIKLFVSLGANNLSDFIGLKEKGLFYSGYIVIIELLKKAGIDNLADLYELRDFYTQYGYKHNLSFFVNDIGIKGKSALLELKELILCSFSSSQKEKVLMLYNDFGIKDPHNLIMLKKIINSGNVEILKLLFDEGIIDPFELKNLEDVIMSRDYGNIKLFLEAGGNTVEKSGVVENYIQIKNIIYKQYPNIKIKELISLFSILNSNDLKVSNLEKLFQFFNPIDIDEIKNFKHVFLFYGDLPNVFEFKESDKNLYLQYIEKFLDMCSCCYTLSYSEKSAIISDIVKLSFGDIENYLDSLNKVCIFGGHPYNQFLKCFDGTYFNEDAFDFLCKGFDIGGNNISGKQNLLNSAVNVLYPGMNINFSNEETEKILGFIDCVGGINKGYTIFVLTIEKMVRDGVDSKKFNQILCEKLDNYKKVFDMYPEDKIPEGLKISIGLEFEITRSFSLRYGRDKYKSVANQIVDKAKIGCENEGEFEFATKPSTNPMVSLLEIHLLQELNLLDINDMQKLSGTESVIRYSGRNGTGYHLNIGSDSEIGIDENIQFIQNMCTILPRSGINNGENVRRINMHSNLNSKSSKFPIFSDSISKKYIELRTYSVDDVELFEKNVLFNTYAIMGSQAQKIVSKITSKNMLELYNDDKISNVDDLMKYLDDNDLFNENQDLKSKKIAVEFLFMQLCFLRTLSDYNHNFIENELFGGELVEVLSSESWKNLFFDLILDGSETMGFGDQGHSSMIVKRFTNLNEVFDFQKYIQKSEPFSEVEAKEILSKNGNNVDEKWIPYITTWLNKQLLWNILCNSFSDTQKLQESINNKISNFDRIKSYIRLTDQNSKIDGQYLKKYFRENMSLIQFNPYYSINVDFINKVINLNNFFLKKDDTNANGVLKKTIIDGVEEPDISKLSIFETGGIMRKGYNYYQGGTENMLLHKTQTIALNYMENVKNILNSDFTGEGGVNSGHKLAA